MYTPKKTYLSLMYTMYVDIIQIIPLIMLMLGHTRYEESPPPTKKKKKKKKERDGAKRHLF